MYSLGKQNASVFHYIVSERKHLNYLLIKVLNVTFPQTSDAIPMWGMLMTIWPEGLSSPGGYSPDPKAARLSAESGFGLRPDPVG